MTVFLISATILFQFGFNSYFNVPLSVIDSSIAYKVIFAFYLFKLSALLALKIWWVLGLAVIFIYIVFAILNFEHWLRIVPIILVIVFLFFCPQMGEYLAKHSEYFYVVNDDCRAVDKDKYVILNFYDDKAILISVGEDAEKVGSKKMAGGFLIKNVSEMGCDIELKKVGIIAK